MKSKKKLNKWTYLGNRNKLTDVENRLMNTGEEGKMRMNGDRSMETYITICKIDSQWESDE